MRRVFVTHKLPGTALERLGKHVALEVNPEERPLAKAELVKGVRGKDALLSMVTDAVDAEVMDAAPELKVISNYAVGTNNIDLSAAAERGIVVTHTPGVLTETTADLAWALLMAVARRVVEADAFTRAGKFRGWGPSMLLGADVYGKTLGVIGLGRIGETIARRASGFDMRVLYSSRTRRPHEKEAALGAAYASIDDLLRQSDYVCLSVPLTDETRHLIGARELGIMKRSAYLINIARGPVVHEAALVDALRKGEIAGAALDVYEDEPRLASGLAELKNVVLAPHIGSATTETRTKMADIVVDDMLAVLRGERPRFAVS